jgi:opacity protein-like surface antigen
MKPISLALVVVCLLAVSACAYDRTLITDQTELDGFVATTVKYIDFKDETGVLVGGRIALIVNHSWGLGAGGYGTIVEPSPEDIEGLEELEMAYGGIVLEYIAWPRAIYHLSIPVLIGGGQVQFEGGYVDPDSGEDSDTFFVIEPHLNLEVNITRNLRLDAGFSYRHVNGTDLADMTDEDLSGVNGVVSLKVGRF